uniref:Uncharacterized protein n=1 Tax=Anguilla anguilla TaxID=7936 RepID=A0A0E9Q1K6_ANGAN
MWWWELTRLWKAEVVSSMISSIIRSHLLDQPT